MKNLFLAFIFMLPLYGAAENSNPYHYTYYQMKDGLCDEFIFSIHEDSFGFMWFCTSNGLDRFDGNEFVHYSSASLDNSHRINSNFVKQVVEDAYRHLWIISDVGLMRIHLETGEVEACTDIEIPHIELLSQPIQALFKDKTGNLWLGISNRVVRVCLDDYGNIARIDTFDTGRNIIVSFTQQDNQIWAGGLSGLCKYAIVSSNEVQPLSMEGSTGLENIPNVQVLFAYGAYLWIGTLNGLYFYDTHNGRLKRYLHEENDPYSISGNNITSLSANKSGDIIIGTRNGVNIYTRNNIFEHIRPDAYNESINTDIINDIFVDGNGAIWVGTTAGGVNLITTTKIKSDHLLKGDRNSENIVDRIFEDKLGNVFASIVNKGLAIRRSGEDHFRLYAFSKELCSLSGNHIRYIAQDYNNNYWIATTEGLNLLKYEDLESPKFISFTTENSSISSNVISDLAVDSIRKGIWICCNNGIDFIDIETHNFTHINCTLEPEEAMKNLFVMCLDSKDNLWLGGNGLYLINLSLKDDITDKFQCKYYRYKLDDQVSKITERISSIIETHDGNIYIGSLNNGLYIVEEKLYSDYLFRNLSVNYVTFNTKISDIQEEKSGNLWLSTVDGLYYYDINMQRARRFDDTDGLSTSQFYVKSSCTLRDGTVCFGTVNGFLNISLPSGLSRTADRKVVISHIQCDDQLLAGNAITEYDVYPEKQSFEVFFSALEYIGQSKIAYTYKMDELDKKWNVCNNQSCVRYTNLPPGNYTLRVKCTNADNFWSGEETVLRIKVHPSFYQTIWFFMLILFMVLSIVVFAVLWYVRHQKKNQKYLREEVAKRTQNLIEQKAKLEQKTDELNETMDNLICSKNAIAEQNILLQSQFQEINEQKDQIEAFSKQMEKANKEKLMLFTHLTHEFKTPLALILGPTHKLAEINKNPQLVELIQVIQRNAQYLLFLLNQIMDLRRVDVQQLNTKEKVFNIAHLFKQDIADFTYILKERHIGLEYRSRMSYDLVKSDRQLIHTILFNLISNAIKYTPNGGTITIRFAQCASADPDVMNQLISVTNTGSYINENERENIFDCFYKVEDQTVYTSYGQSSTGIGLFLVKQMIQALNGHVSLKSLSHKVTTFRVWFPVQRVEEEHVEVLAPVTQPTMPEDLEDIPFTAIDDHKPILLVVEDNKDMREYIKSFLDKSYNVAEAINGEKGLKMARQIIPDLIISDMMMPICDGLEFCKGIRSEETLSHIPFMMLTALSDDNARLESYNQGVDAFLTKPFESETLLARIDNILRKNKTRQKELSYDLSQAHSSVLVKDADKQFLERLTEIMEANYADSEFYVTELLEGMGMSSTSFYKKIIALTGLSASHFIRLYRLQTAKRIIDNMEYNQGANISEIAYQVGFNDPKYFTRCFVKQYKVPPSALLSKK